MRYLRDFQQSDPGIPSGKKKQCDFMITECKPQWQKSFLVWQQQQLSSLVLAIQRNNVYILFFFSFEEEEEEKGLNQGRQNRHSLTKATVTLCTVNKDIFNGRRIFLPIRSALSILYRHLEPVLQEQQSVQEWHKASSVWHCFVPIELTAS